MSHSISAAFFISVAGVLTGPPSAHSYAATPSVSSEHDRACYFSNDKAVVPFLVRTAGRLPTDATWSVAVHDKVVRRGTSRLDSINRGTGRATLEVALPEVLSGSVTPVTIVFQVSGAGTATANLFVYPRNVSDAQLNQLRTLPVHVFDPDGETAEMLTDTSFQFRRILRLEQLSNVRNGVLVIGEGVSFREFRPLAETIAKLASQGVHVVCLSPKKLILSVKSLNSSDGLPPKKLLFDSHDRIRSFDHRFDVTSWCSGRPLNRPEFRLAGLRQGVAIESDDDGDWSWVEVEYENARGRLTLTSAPIIQNWKASPVPRHLFAQLLRSVKSEH